MLYCHDNEHQRQVDLHYQKKSARAKRPQQTFKGLAGLADLLKSQE